MIEQQIRPWDVLDAEVLQLLGLVRREEFVPAPHRSIAFADMEIPLTDDVTHAMASGQCMLAPKVEARMLQDLQIEKTHRVLEVGTGSGYMAALLGWSAASVLSLELDRRLAAFAIDNLERALIGNVEVRCGDGSQGAPRHGPFDAIVLSGSVSEIPKSLLSQLTIGGRIVAIVGQMPMMRATTVTRHGPDAWSTLQPWDTVAPRLRHFPEPSRFTF
ncbi:MAG: protein-L-isoaspartate O-methyltransferase [Burkholderiales bacterium]